MFLGATRRFTHHHRKGAVGFHATKRNHKIKAHYIAFLQNVVSWNTVNNLLVHRDTHTGWEVHFRSFIRRDCPVLNNLFFHPGI